MEPKEVNDWSIPNDEGSISVPDALVPLFNKVATQLRFHTISDKNEVITVAHIVQHAIEYADQVASRRTPQWVSVKERLPEGIGDKVQVALSDSTVLVGRLYSNGWAAFFMDGESLVTERSVTHWMPLPEPPKI